jgi:anthranilate phosphoribosyltransferase
MSQEIRPAYRQAIGRLLEGADLLPEQVASFIDAYSSRELTDAQAAAVLTALTMRGETAAELAAAARSLLASSLALPRTARPCLDTCGTGGDGRSTLNVSTAAGLVAAACGARVVKHGNRAVSGTSGSADVLERLGVPVDQPPDEAAAALERHGFAFCFAPNYHPAVARFGPLRRQLGFRTLFNRLGPLLNPARVEHQLVGVGRPEWLDTTAEALRLLGLRRAAVVWSESGADEIDLSGPCHFRLVTPSGVEAGVWSQADFGSEPVEPHALSVSSAEESAVRIRAAFAGSDPAAQRVIAANAGAALWIYGLDSKLSRCVESASAAMTDGRATNLLKSLAKS